MWQQGNSTLPHQQSQVRQQRLLYHISMQSLSLTITLHVFDACLNWDDLPPIFFRGDASCILLFLSLLFCCLTPHCLAGGDALNMPHSIQHLKDLQIQFLKNTTE